MDNTKHLRQTKIKNQNEPVIAVIYRNFKIKLQDGNDQVEKVFCQVDFGTFLEMKFRRKSKKRYCFRLENVVETFLFSLDDASHRKVTDSSRSSLT